MNVQTHSATISLKNLELSTIIGCYRAEKDTPQPIFIDLDIETDISKVYESDALEDALDYVLIVEKLKELAKTHGCELLEAFGRKVVATLSEFSEIKSFELTIKKPNAIPETEFVCLRFSAER